MSDMQHDPAHQHYSSLLGLHRHWQLNNCVLLLLVPDSVIFMLLALTCHFLLAWSLSDTDGYTQAEEYGQRLTAARSFIGAVILHWNEKSVGSVQKKKKKRRIRRLKWRSERDEGFGGVYHHPLDTQGRWQALVIKQTWKVINVAGV